jgi:hypothetical protein
MIYPEGVGYNREKGTFLTEKVNMIFAAISDPKGIPEDDENKRGRLRNN